LTGGGCRRAEPRIALPTVVRYVDAQSANKEPRLAPGAYIAQVRADLEVDLSFKLPGVLELIGPQPSQDWQEGAQVAVGHLLAQLVQSDLQNNLRSAQARAELEQKLLERSQRLRNTQVISPQEYDIIEANAKSSDAELAKARQALMDSQLRAPFNGTILARMASAGETVTAGRTLLRLADMRQMSVELGVPDRLVETVSRLRDRGDPVPVKISALGERHFMGQITEVGVAAREGARLFKVTIKVPNPDGRIKSGMTATVALEMPAASSPEAVLVPLSALVMSSCAGSTNLVIFVVGPDNLVQEREVQTDEIVRNSILVKSGIKAGEKVVVMGASLLQNGALVQAQRLAE